MRIHFTVTAEIDSAEFFKNEGVNWKFCKAHATFHNEEACEFLLHVGPGAGKDTRAAMRKFGCTPDFIAAYREAALQGAVRVIFYS